MECYRFAEGLTPLEGKLPREWKRLLVLTRPAELAEFPLPEGVQLPEAPEHPHESQFCWLRAERSGIFAQIRVPALAGEQPPGTGSRWDRLRLREGDPGHAAP